MIAFAFYILPSIEQVFKQIDAPLPLPTKIILSASGFVKANPLLLFGGIFGIIVLFFILLKIKKGRYMIHYLILRIPLFGPLIKEYNLEGSITPPTLAKLFSYVSALHNENTPKEVSATIYNSLYPKWLAKESKKVVSNPSSVVYVGKMPLGRWEVLN